MVVVDANVLLYAVDSASSHHDESRGWLDGALAGAETVGFAWVVLLAFLRISTNAAIFPQPMAVEDATEQVERWLGAPAAAAVQPSTRHAALLRGFLVQTGTAGNLTTNTHLATLAVEHGAEIVSYDRGFGRFPGVSHRLPA